MESKAAVSGDISGSIKYDALNCKQAFLRSVLYYFHSLMTVAIQIYLFSRIDCILILHFIVGINLNFFKPFP